MLQKRMQSATLKRNTHIKHTYRDYVHSISGAGKNSVDL